jgi:signal transduction histidine kinase
MFTNIIMTSDWDSLPERTKTNIQKISDAAIRMQKLIEGVLSYSSINAQVKKEKASLEALLQEAIRNLEYKVQETGAAIVSDGLPEAEVIPLQMQQLFQNLIVNALKFSKKMVTPEVRIAHRFLSANQVQNKQLATAKRYLQIDISDNGIGFGQEAAEKIFGLFQRLHNRSDYEGSGIGLAICKRIVENHEGVISATSEVGVGSTFSVILPL